MLTLINIVAFIATIPMTDLLSVTLWLAGLLFASDIADLIG